MRRQYTLRALAVHLFCPRHATSESERRKRLDFTLFRSLTLAILVAAAAAAQTNTGEIQGVVQDPLGGVLPGATVTLVHARSGLRLERVSDADGRFYLPALPVGEYTMSVAECVRREAAKAQSEGF